MTSSPATYRRAVVRYLRDEYGVAEVKEPPRAGGGDHPRLRFSYAGRERTLTLHGTASKVDAHALAMKLQDIRRDLGPPPARCEANGKRKLENMMPDLPPEAKALEPLSSYPKPPPAVGAGRVALYENGGSRLLRFHLPEAAVERFVAGGFVSIHQIEGIGWQIRHARSGRTEIRHDPKKGWTVNRTDTRAEISAGIDPFPSTPTEVTATADEIHVRALFNQARPSRSGRPRKVKSRDMTPHALILEHPESSIKPAATADIRAALEAVRRIEAETAYRLVKLKDPERWAFRAVVE